MASRRGRTRTRGRIVVDDEIAISVPPMGKSTVLSPRTRASSAGTPSASNGETNSGDNLSPETMVESPVTGKRSRFEPRSMMVRLGTFNGRDIPLATFLAKFRNCADYYQWTERDRLFHLKASLEGNAASLLWELDNDCSESQLLQRLQSRFGEVQQVEKYRAQLRARRRRKDESVQSLYQDVCTLLALSYPGESSHLGQLVARDAFLDCLGDPQMRVRILERDIESLEGAFSFVVKYESFLAGCVVPDADEGSRHRVRAVAQPEVGESKQLNDEWKTRIESSIARLSRQVETSLNAVFKQQQVNSGDSKVGQSAVVADSRPPAQDQRNFRRGASGTDLGKTCFSCHKPGHFKRDCPLRGGQRDTSRYSSAPVTGLSESGKLSQASTRLTVDEIDRTREVVLPIRIKKEGHLCSVNAIVDTGSKYSILPAKYVNGHMRPCRTKLSAVNGSEISVVGEKRVEFQADGVNFYADFVISEQVDEILIGSDWLEQNRCVWDFENLTIRVNGKALQLKRRATSTCTRRVLAAERIKLEPKAFTPVPVRLAHIGRRTVQSNFLIEPKFVGQGAILSRGVFGNDAESCVSVLNLTDEPMWINRWQNLGNAHMFDLNCKRCGSVCLCPVDDVVAPLQPTGDGQPSCVASVRSIAENKSISANVQNSSGEQRSVEGASNGSNETELSAQDRLLIKPIMDGLPQCLARDERTQVEALLTEYIGIFSKNEYDVGKTHLMTYKLELADPSLPPVKQPLRNHPISHLDLIDSEVNKLLSAGLIAPTSSSWSSNVVLVRKKPAPGETSPRYRVAIDYRQLNTRVKRITYPMIQSVQIFDSLRGQKFFSTLDLTNAFLSIELDPETSHYSSFCTRRGLYKFLRLPAGLHNSPHVFNQLIVEKLLSDLMWTQVLPFLDDLTIPSINFQQGLVRLKEVFNRLKNAGLKLKANKCQLFQVQVKILGVIVSENQLAVDPSRTEALTKLPFPRTVRELRSLLGAANFSRSFYPNFAQLAEPLTRCLKRGARVEKTAETVEAYERLIDLMSSPPVLGMFDVESTRYELEVDASYHSIGACFRQTSKQGVTTIIAYYSKSLSDQELRYCVTRKELAAVIKSLKHFKHYLIGRKVFIKTDHACLQYLFSAKVLPAQWSRYLDFLSEFDIEIVWNSGSNQCISDHLSRVRPCEHNGAILCKQCRVRDERVLKRVVTRVKNAGPRGVEHGPEARGNAVRFAGDAMCHGCQPDNAVGGETFARAGQHDGAESWSAVMGVRDRIHDQVFPPRDCQGRPLADPGLEWQSVGGLARTRSPGQPDIGGQTALHRPALRDTGETDAASAGLLTSEVRGLARPDRRVAEPVSGATANSLNVYAPDFMPSQTAVWARTASAEATGAKRLPAQAGKPEVDVAPLTVARSLLTQAQQLPLAGGETGGQADVSQISAAEVEAQRNVSATALAETRRVVTRAQGALANDSGASEANDATESGARDSNNLHAMQGERSGSSHLAESTIINPTGGRKRRRPLANVLQIADLWQSNHIIQEQQIDPILSIIKDAVVQGSISSDVRRDPRPEMQCYIRQLQSLTVRDGILYRMFVKPNGTVDHYQLIVPKSLREPFLEIIHTNVLGHLRSFYKHEAHIIRLAYWCTWKRDLRIYLTKCRWCLESGRRLPKNGLLRPRGGQVAAPGTTIAVDLVGPLPSSNSYKYFISIVDQYTKYLWLHPLVSKEAVGVARALLRFCLNHGFPSRLHSDLGTEFINEVCSQLFQLTGIKHHTSFAYQPRQNESERSHKVIHQILSRILENHKDWSVYLPFVAFVYNSSVHKATSFSPHQLHFGRELASSFEILLANPQGGEGQNYGEFVSQTVERMQTTYKIALEVLRKSAQSAKRNYDSHVRPKVFNEGDSVLVYQPKRKKQTFPKWCRPFGEQATIVKRINDITYMVRFERSRKVNVVHVDKLKLLAAAQPTGQSEAVVGQPTV